MPVCGRDAENLYLYIDKASLATLSNLTTFYTTKAKTRRATRSMILRRSLEALRRELATLETLPEGHPDVVLEGQRLSQFRRARPSVDTTTTEETIRR
jgi:hypothetical protein